jgi:hypothetical protein
MKVWIVCMGDYSDRSIRAVFSTEEKARAYATPLRSEDISEFEVDSETPGPVGMTSWLATVEVDTGNLTYLRQSDKEPGPIRLWNDPDGFTEEHPHELTFGFWARDEEHATKLVAERRQEWRANPVNEQAVAAARERQQKICGNCKGRFSGGRYCVLPPGHGNVHKCSNGSTWPL